MIIVATSTATPEAPTPLTETARPRLQFTWTGTDGVEWDLTSGPIRLARGASGFGLPKPTHWLQEAPTLDGASWQGMRTGPREVFLPVNVRGSDADDMLAIEAAFFAGLDPQGEGVLRATTHRGTFREIRLRYDDGADIGYELDPVLIRYAPYPLRFVAADPYWTGPELVFPIRYPDAIPSFFTGPPFRLAPSQILGAAEIVNPGDVDAFPVWRVDGPFTSFSVGVGDSLVEWATTKAAGEFVEIDMNRDRLTIVDEDGDDIRRRVDVAAFSAIPAGTVMLDAALVTPAPGSAVTLTFTPRYRRAW